MDYFDDYGSSRSKIPYDDVPVTRNERQTRYGSSGRGGGRRTRTAPSYLVSFGLIINLLLSVVCLFLIGTRKYRTINNYVVEVGAGSEVSLAVKSQAITSTVCVVNSESSGSGVIYKIDRKNNTDTESADYNKGTIYFATCYHVVEKDTKNIEVQLSSYSSETIDVSLVGYSETYDVAVLKYDSNDLNETLWGCSAIDIFDSTYVSQGEQIFAVGNPLGMGITITDGLISQVNSLISVDLNSEASRCLKISAEINRGNSGGGLFNAKGEFIGLVNAKLEQASTTTETFDVEGTSYAIPSSVVRGIADQIIATSKTQSSSTAIKAKHLNLNVTFANSQKKTMILRDDGGRIEKYEVKVSRVGSGIAKDKLYENYVIEKIEYTDVLTGEEKTQEMLNLYSFEDCVFSIKPNSTVKFYVVGKTSPVEIVASSFKTV